MPRILPSTAPICSAFRLEDLHIIAKQLHDQLRSRSGHKLVDTALYGLAEAECHPRDVGERVSHLFGHFIPIRRRFPLRSRLEDSGKSGFVDTPRLERDTRLSGPRNDGRQFRELLELLLDEIRDIERLGQGNAGQELHVHIERAFIHDRNEFRSEPRHNE